MDGGQEGQGAVPQKPGHEVPPAAVAVDEVEALLPDQGPQLRRHGREVLPGIDPGVDAHLPGLPGEFSLHEADHGHADLLSQGRQQTQDVSLGAAHVAAADEGQDLHACTPLPPSVSSVRGQDSLSASSCAGGRNGVY